MGVTDDIFYNAVDLLNKSLDSEKSKNYVSISLDDQKLALKNTMEHLDAHNKEFSIEPKTLDIYKLLSWYGYFLSNITRDYHRVVYLMTIRELNLLLSKEKCGKHFTRDFTTKIYQMLRRDDEDGKFSIGKNGLYLSFRSAKDICKQL